MLIALAVFAGLAVADGTSQPGTSGALIERRAWAEFNEDVRAKLINPASGE